MMMVVCKLLNIFKPLLTKYQCKTFNIENFNQFNNILTLYFILDYF